MTVPGWRELPSEHGVVYSPVGLRLVDEFTGRAPLGSVSAELDRQVSPGVWEATGMPPVVTPSGVVAWPGLGRSREPASAPTGHYRARIAADRYRPAYLENADGVEFDAPPWDDQTPPVPTTTGPVDAYLLPAAAYDFPTWVRVLRGFVEDASGAPVPNVLVHQAAAERALTDERGTFSLPLRWAASGMVVDANDVRTGRAGSHTLSLPSDLLASVTITIA